VAKTRRPSVPAVEQSRRRAYWRSLIEECQRSGLKQGEFCRRRGVVPGTLAFWKHTLAREARDARSSPRGADVTPTFLPVRVITRPPSCDQPTRPAGPALDGEIEIMLEGGRRVRVRGRVDLAWLGDVLRTVTALGC
jgi:hypothetical protein